MSDLMSIEPKKVFGFFKEISDIPHGSRNTKQISDYLVQFAKDRNLEYYQDDTDNVIIYKNATSGYENAEPLILQGHIDMVCDKAADCPVDMEKEGLKLALDGDWLYAEGTSLGGDDGIAVAMTMAVLDSEDIKHPRIEAVFTTDEEIGMLGAIALDVSKLSAKKLLNIDSEEEGILTVSCSGGGSASCHIPLKRTEKTGKKYKLSIGGLKGGHSGMEIDKMRANANILMGRLLEALEGKSDFSLIALAGGTKDNAIAKDCVAELIINPENAESFETLIKETDNIFRDEYKTPDPGIVVKAEALGEATESVLDSESLKKLIDFLVILPYGVQHMSADIEGLVETSLNIGILELKDRELTAGILLRSAKGTRFDSICNKINRLVALLEGKVEYFGLYPGWEYRVDSPLRETCQKVFRQQYGKDPKVEAIHAGLECGMFAGKMQGDIDAISIGPTMKDVHTFNERLSVSSVERTWKYLCGILEASN